MTTTVELPKAELSPLNFSVTDAAIAQLRDEYLPLTISGIDDKEGLKAVHDARMLVKSKRVEVEKTRKELKADALEYGRKVDAEAKRIKLLLAPIEDHLQSEEQRVIDEKARIKREEEEKRQRALEARLNQLTDVGCMMSPMAVEKMTDVEFADRLKVATELHEKKLAAEREAEAKREAERIAEEEKRKAEEERLRIEREELEAERERQRLAEEERFRKIEERERQQREEQERLDAERARLEAEEAERQRQIKAEEDRKAAEERARIEERERIEREAAEKKAREEAEAAEAKRQEALRPDKEKLMAVADAVDALILPEVSSDAEFTRAAVETILQDAATGIRKVVETM